MKRAVALVVFAAALETRVARADDMADAKQYFKAGASAYTAGDYLAAIQALDAAYRLTPLPAIAFSLAQAERRQYFVSRDPAHLVRAIELYRTYLKQVPTGGRVADATDALAQLEPLALGITAGPPGEAGASPIVREVGRTRLMVTSEATGARISLDGENPKPTPLIAEVKAGEHVVHVSADGYVPSERRVVAIAGELVPLEVELRERPAVVILEPSVEADLYVDGSYFGRVGKGARIELPAGSHRFAFARRGWSLESQVLGLERGETQHLPVKLYWTHQRAAAVTLFAGSAITLVGGLAFTGLGVESERQAESILAQQEERSLSPAELDDYEEALEMRDRYRIAAIGSYAVSVVSLVTGAFLYGFDEPDLREVITNPKVDREKQKMDVKAAVAPAPGGLRAAVRVAF
jgi:tetratricopeptide (TPR) repeat protein